MRGDWARYRFGQLCHVCGHKGGWCMFKGPSDNPLAVLCTRISEGCARNKQGAAITARDGMGWVHDLRKDVTFVRSRRRPLPVAPAVLPDMSEMAAVCEDYASDADLKMWGRMLGVTAESLQRINAGWCVERLDTATGEVKPVNACTFPMRDANDRIIGIRLRLPSGQKYAMPGSANGLIIPRELSGNGPLLIVEGPTETAAALDLTFDAIGRPGNTAGRELLVAYCKRHRREVVILRNNDPKGSDAERLTIMGANNLAGDLVKAKIGVRIIWPPTVKDLRDWKNKEKATMRMILEIIRQTPRFTV